jgi:hypothetical protein
MASLRLPTEWKEDTDMEVDTKQYASQADVNCTQQKKKKKSESAEKDNENIDKNRRSELKQRDAGNRKNLASEELTPGGPQLQAIADDNLHSSVTKADSESKKRQGKSGSDVLGWDMLSDVSARSPGSSQSSSGRCSPSHREKHDGNTQDTVSPRAESNEDTWFLIED